MNAAIFIAAAAVLIATAIAVVLVIKRKKNKPGAALICGGALLFGTVIWFFLPFKMLDISPEKIESVTIFSGQTGQAAEITDEEDLRKIADALEGVTLRREKVDWRTGYDIRITVRCKNGIDKDYIVNGAKKVSHGMVIYKVTDGEVDYDLLKGYLN